MVENLCFFKIFEKSSKMAIFEFWVHFRRLRENVYRAPPGGYIIIHTYVRMCVHIVSFYYSLRVHRCDGRVVKVMDSRSHFTESEAGRDKGRVLAYILMSQRFCFRGCCPATAAYGRNFIF